MHTILRVTLLSDKTKMFKIRKLQRHVCLDKLDDYFQTNAYIRERLLGLSRLVLDYQMSILTFYRRKSDPFRL